MEWGCAEYSLHCASPHAGSCHPDTSMRIISLIRSRLSFHLLTTQLAANSLTKESIPATSMSKSCMHADVREFDGLRSCLACGETRFREDKANAQGLEYIYTDLRCLEQGNTIRVVVLPPGAETGPIHCTIVLSGLQHSEYEAISYTWATEDGDDAKTQLIYIDDSAFYVTENCEAALRRLRHPERHRRLWVDAICINQSNVNERNHQVGLMDQIYQKATKVHVCISDPERDYSACLHALVTGSYEAFDKIGIRSQLSALLSRRYFNRVWVVQELDLAKVIILHVNTARVAFSKDVTSLLRFVCRKNNITIPGPLESVLTFIPSRTLAQRLMVSMQLSCSDPRDRLYGVVSLLKPSIRSLIAIDYSSSIEEVYATALWACISETSNLTIFSYACLSPPERGTPLEHEVSLSSEQFFQYLQAEGRRKQKMRVLNYEFSKWLPYVCTGPVALQDAQSSLRQSHGQYSLVERRSHPRPNQHILPCLTVNIVEMDRSQGSWQLNIETIVADYPTNLPLADRSRMLASFKASWNNTRLLPDLVEDCFEHCLKELRTMRDQSHLSGARVFGTDLDVGFSKAYSQTGDIVCHIDGADGLFLLRRVSDERFRLVGSCYLLIGSGRGRGWDIEKMKGKTSWGPQLTLRDMQDANYRATGERRTVEIY
jgi:hypothetical protein